MSYALLIFLGLLPSFAWLIFFLKEDSHPEPKKMILKSFIFGALITVFAALLQRGSLGILKFVSIGEFSFITFLLFGAIEETLKFSAAWLAVSKSKYFDEPIDAMIYMIVTALGFALIENVSVALSTPTLSVALITTVMRFVGATLLHTLSSAIVGYYWSKGIIEYKSQRLKHKRIIIKGLVIASVLHAIFNYLIIVTKNILVYPTLLLILIAFFVFWDFERIKGSAQNH